MHRQKLTETDRSRQQKTEMYICRRKLKKDQNRQHIQKQTETDSRGILVGSVQSAMLGQKKTIFFVVIQ